MNSEHLNQLIGTFMAEAQEFLQLLEANLLEIEAVTEPSARSQAVKTLFRAAHSLKGSALMFGFDDLAQAAHHLEDCFAILRDRIDLVQLPGATVTLLLQGVDRLKVITAGVQSGDAADQADLEAISSLKAKLETIYGVESPAIFSTPNNSIDRQVVQAIFAQELPPVLNQLEIEISQAQEPTLPQTVENLAKIYRQLSGLAAMLQLPEFGAIAESISVLASEPQLTVACLQSRGWAIAQNLQTARDQVLQGKVIAVESVDAMSAADDLLFTDDFLDLTATANNLPLLELAPLTDDKAAVLQVDTVTQERMPTSGAWQRPTVRVDVEQLNQLVNLVGELAIARTNLKLQELRLRSEIKQIRQQVSSLHQSDSNLRDDYDRLSIRHQSPAMARSLSIGHFDDLEMDNYSQFHSTAQSMLDNTSAIALAATKVDTVALQFERHTDRLHRITHQLQNRIMQLRVVPFSRAVDHLPRAVRELSRSHDKAVSLLLLGRETKIDQSLLEALRDPLGHLVRNAFDHGIESADLRQRLGKPVNGQIEIEACHQGGQTIVTIRDDGRGIDLDALRCRVVEKGFVSAEQAAELSVAELYEFLFLPGFSTKTEVSDLSGRGVGLDVVRANLQQVRGAIKIESQLGEGTSFILKLPLMVSITQALLVKTDHNTVAIPIDAIEEIIYIQPTQIYWIGDRPMLRWRDEFIRLHRLQELLHYNSSPDRPSPDPMLQDSIPVAILTSSEGIAAIAVEQLLGHQEIVMKPLPAPLSKPRGVAGSTILGNGCVVMILDVDDLIDPIMPPRAETEGKQYSSVPSLTTQRQILVVDDSYTIRQLLSLTLNRARYQVVQAKDGQDAWEQLQQGLVCDLVITDLEMPRMDGFELVQNLKSNSTFAHLPVAILTSRSGSKHRQLALDLGVNLYLTKPYQEAQLLAEVAQMLQS